MIFRRYTVVAILLFSMTLFAQTPAPSAHSPAPSQAATAAPRPTGPYAPMSKGAEARGRQVFQMWDSGQAGALWATFTDNLKKRTGGEAKFVAYAKALKEKMGSEKAMVKEIMAPTMLSYGTTYSRLSDYTKIGAKVGTTIMMNDKGVVEAFIVAPDQAVPEGRYAGYQDTAQLRLPFDGEWFVIQGGHTPFENSYMRYEEGRFSIDFVLLKNGVPFAGDSNKNESFFCFGQPLLAPADGTVVRVENGYADNQPGTPTQDAPAGNMVVILHGNKEFSVLDHVKQNSITVKKGDAVKQGDPVAACGNSGNSPAPHVHYQLRNSAGMPPPDPLAAQFHDYIADGKPVAVGEPVKGQTVSNAPKAAGTQPATMPEPTKEPVKK